MSLLKHVPEVERVFGSSPWRRSIFYEREHETAPVAQWSQPCRRPVGAERASSMFNRLDKRRIVIASAGLVHALRNDPFPQGVFRRRAQQRAGAFARDPRARVAPVENDGHSIVKGPHPMIRLADDDRRVRKIVAAIKPAPMVPYTRISGGPCESYVSVSALVVKIRRLEPCVRL